MKTKQIVGFALMGASIGVLSFIYFGFLKPRLEVDSEIKKTIATDNKL